jgi:hypothetical protein
VTGADVVEELDWSVGQVLAAIADNGLRKPPCLENRMSVGAHPRR